MEKERAVLITFTSMIINLYDLFFINKKRIELNSILFLSKLMLTGTYLSHQTGVDSLSAPCCTMTKS